MILLSKSRDILLNAKSLFVIFDENINILMIDFEEQKTKSKKKCF